MIWINQCKSDSEGMKYSLMKSKHKAIFLLLFVLVIILAIRYSRRSGYHQKAIRNILLISIDTCRADYLSCYGYKRKTTPNIDKLANNGFLFKNVISPIPMTLPAHSSIFTGTIPPYHGVHDNLNHHLGPANVTLAEKLKENGFTTGAVISAFVLDSWFGMDQGFDTYNDSFKNPLEGNSFEQRAGGETTQFAIEWLNDNKDERFFLFLHYFDPHSNYEPPEPFASKFGDNSYAGLYAGEIAFADHCIGQVVTELKRLGLYDSTLIIVTGDHGEMLGDHGEDTHAYFIYQPAIKVPLIFKFPGQNKKKTIKAQVGLIDIAPTLYSILGIEKPAEVQGTDLSVYFKENEPPKQERYYFCESLEPTKYKLNSLLGVVTDRFKYIQTTRPELYDLARDPGEKTNLAEKLPQQARILKDKLKHILELSIRKEELDSSIEISAEARRKLESLGYVSGTVDKAFDFDQTKEDPKDFIKIRNLSTMCGGLIAQNRLNEAREAAKKILLLKSDSYAGHIDLAEIAKKEKNYPEAIMHLKNALKFDPDNFHGHNNLAMLYDSVGKLDESITHFRRAVQIVPHFAEVHSNLAVILRKLDRLDEAVEHCRKALQIDPDNFEAHNNMGNILQAQGKLEEALSHYQHALQIKPGYALAHHNLGNLLRAQDKFDDGIDHYHSALQADSKFAQIYAHLGKKLLSENSADEAIVLFRLVLDVQPGSAEIYYDLAKAYQSQGKLEEAVANFNEALRRKPHWARAHYKLGSICFRQRNFDQAAVHYKESLKLEPNSFGVLNDLAWISAAYKDTKHYNPTEAVKYAQKACELTDYQRPELLDTLAVAYGAAGDYTKAIETAEKAIQLAVSAGKEELAGEIQKHLELYKAHRPYLSP